MTDKIQLGFQVLKLGKCVLLSDIREAVCENPKFDILQKRFLHFLTKTQNQNHALLIYEDNRILDIRKIQLPILYLQFLACMTFKVISYLYRTMIK